MPDCYGNKMSLADWRKYPMSGDQEKVLSVPVVRVSLPCEECGKPGVNLKYNLVGIEGVLCRECLTVVIGQVNYALDTTAKESVQDDKGKHYTCLECGISLAFPDTIFYHDLTYCTEHAPYYDKHSQF